jgi:hypothetical protein
LINAIIGDFFFRFLCHIQLEACLNLTSDIHISDIDITTITYNILSNAWEYCCSKDRKKNMWTKFQFSTNRNYLHIKCSNPLEEDLKTEGMKILTTKKNKTFLHGIGLRA